MIINTVKNSISLVLLTLFVPLSVNAAFAPNGTVADANDYDAVPPSSGTKSPPMVMLALSNDHQLYFKSFSDYEDLDGDGTPEITYTHSIDYVGYFDPNKCYTYSSTDGRFNPTAFTANKYCTSAWSGNFLNWATMTRMDQIRKVFYGGTRTTDSTSLTILERSFLVNDAHSFAKYYNGTDIELLTPYNPTEQGAATSTSGMTFCNTTYVSTGASDSVDTTTHPPLLRIVEGNYSLWAAGERFQCRFSDELSGSRGTNGNNPTVTTINASSSSPDVADKIADLTVRVSVCVDGLEEDNCKAYPTSTHKKPTGLLHEFGDEDDVLFGLVTGSYKLNKSGGVLRKNIASWTNEVNVNTDGIFAATPSSGGIVNTLDKLRLIRYDFADGIYNSLDNCGFGLSSFNDGDCKNWGNPFAEIMMECYRYFSGATADTNFTTDDSTLVSGLTTATWANPQNSQSNCAKLSIVAINASTISYDADQLSGVTDLNTASSAAALTDTLGADEGINGNDYFVGEVVGGDQNQLCSGKTVSTLGNVLGTCPDSPRLGGSYQTAGLAYHAFKTDLRSDLDENQTVDTYAISLAPVASADIPIPTSTNTIKLLPACRNLRPNPDGNCAIVDFKVLSLPVEAGGVVTASYYVNWEDSEQGGDFDQDMHGLIAVTVTTNTVSVTTRIIGQSTPYELGFGYVIGGTTSDGFYAQSGINGYDESECSSTPCNSGDAAATKNFTIGASTSELLEPPLFYAAKYGNFNDFDNDGTPSTTAEWDAKDQDGSIVPGGDGIPDAYFPVTNPASIQSSLSTVLNAIVEGQTSSSAAAVVGNSSDGTGAVYQAAYEATSLDVDGNSVNWTGSILSFFIDSDSRLREDACDPTINLLSSTTLCNKRLDITDPEIRFNADVTDADGDGDTSELVIDRYDPATGLLVPAPATVLSDQSNSPQGAPISSIELIWDVNENLSSISDVTTQRTYSSSASNGRYIRTWIDEDSDTIVDSSEVVDFTAANFPAIDAVDTTIDPRRYLGFESATDITDTDGVDISDKLVNFIRGKDEDMPIGWRSRQFNDGSGAQTRRLGDIVNSTPIIIGRPDADYNFRYTDAEYRFFSSRYADRRQVVYVGANDGMLHAFNGGFYDAATKGFYTTSAAGTGSETAHPLGSELWAYVPQSLLPHLQWLREGDYPHVYYVDGDAQKFDVNIFDGCSNINTCKHPFGWGTILVVTMRLGGGEITFDPNSDDDATDADGDGDVTLKSSVLIFDVTDPESEPELLAEISHDDLGFTTSTPALYKSRPRDTDGDFDDANSEWYVYMGTGARGTDGDTVSKQAALDSVVSSEPAKLMRINLKTMQIEQAPDAGSVEAAAFVSDISVMDWDNDYTDDVVYFGTASGPVNLPTGALYRYRPNYGAGTLDTMLDSDQPYTAAPRPLLDRQNRRWVFAGTGRFYAADDILSATQQSFHGILEATDLTVSISPYNKTSLIDTTDVEVFTTGEVEIADASPINLTFTGGSGSTGDVSTYSQLQQAIPDSGANGWYIDFPLYTGKGSSRNLLSPVLIRDVLVFDEYTASGQLCSPNGNSSLRNLNMITGTASPYVVFATDPGNITQATTGGVEVLSGVDLGSGRIIGIAPHNDSIIVSEGGGENLEISTQVPTITNVPSGRRSWREIPLNL